ncbi:ABC transporter permease [Streptomyces boninensis]|uniref:ABC transporter permease n=1 Tax=Streptomyces boninensis TaxID=2039455 RepID=UPI003B219E80
MPDALTKTKATEVPDAAAVAEPRPDKARSLWSDAWRDLRRNPYFLVSAVLIVLLLTITAFPGWFTSVGPREFDLKNHYLTEPEWGHFFQPDWFGYDKQGQSIYSRVIYGTRASVLVGVSVTAIVVLFGGIVGLVAGYFGGWVDSVLSRLIDIFFGIPFLLGTMVIMQSVTDRKWWMVSLALAFLGWTQVARVMRGSVITVKQSDYVQAAKALGASTWRIMLKHVLPNAVAPVIVVATIALGTYITAEATLSYLGLGLSAPSVSWGGDISVGADNLRNAPHTLMIPSAMLSICVLAFIMLGEAVRNALDPKLR